MLLQHTPTLCPGFVEQQYGMCISVFLALRRVVLWCIRVGEREKKEYKKILRCSPLIGLKHAVSKGVTEEEHSPQFALQCW